mmetsp:Transcript_21478/g.59721  ORF Transcript_21478/g.59721 Transcript_21478/m.59721 type:complete len:105 (-) Transcript_21478:26-340(-)
MALWLALALALALRMARSRSSRDDRVGSFEAADRVVAPLDLPFPPPIAGQSRVEVSVARTRGESTDYMNNYSITKITNQDLQIRLRKANNSSMAGLWDNASCHF